jgi:SOS-response transcriptional repressor LexA
MRNRKSKIVTPVQKETYLIIDEFWRTYGFGPTIDDIMYMTGEKSRSNVHRKMWRLVELGLCKGVKNRARSIRPANFKLRNIE